MPELGDISKNKRSQKLIWAACEDCGKGRWVQAIKGVPKHHRCLACHNAIVCLKGENHPRWTGGRLKDRKGYITVKIFPDNFFYPMANERGRVREHRLVVAKALNRCLLPWEVVHHKEGFAKDDNRYPETLELFPTNKGHNILTHSTNAFLAELEKRDKRIEQLEGRVTLLEAENVLLQSSKSISIAGGYTEMKPAVII
uniref:Uncharacterized protein n=1 Tax=viral metagenome TaxID=1070528 RepID=A0A6M3KYU1_9ZZZZ